MEVSTSDDKKHYRVAPKTLEFYGVPDEQALQAIVMPWSELDVKLKEVEQMSSADIKSCLEAVRVTLTPGMFVLRSILLIWFVVFSCCSWIRNRIRWTAPRSRPQSTPFPRQPPQPSRSNNPAPPTPCKASYRRQLWPRTSLPSFPRSRIFTLHHQAAPRSRSNSSSLNSWQLLCPTSSSSCSSSRLRRA